jgi:cytochrome c peroxidase
MRRLLLFVLPLAFLSTACQDGDVPGLMEPGDAPLLANVPNLGDLEPHEALGKALYFDTRLSLKQNQSCATCHAPEYGFSGPNAGINLRGAVYPGSVKNRFGNRRPPTAAYATLSPILYMDESEGLPGIPVGGNFWDGRATGEVLGNPAADQAIGPFLNHVEQALIDEICVIYRVAWGPYADLWVEAWGDDLRTLEFPKGLDKACRNEDEITYPGDLEGPVLEAYGKVGMAIAAFEGSSEVNAFSSKFDAVVAGIAAFTEQEAWGRELFDGEAQCNLCHPSTADTELSDYALFTDYTYDNLGVPANPLNPQYPGFVDEGIGPILGRDDLYGAVKVPTLRNLAKAPGSAVKSFAHNGVFKSLEQIVHFYNTRDVLPTCDEMPTTVADLMMMGTDCWPSPEVAENVNTDELGDLGLSLEEEQAIVAFLRTLSDGWTGP